MKFFQATGSQGETRDKKGAWRNLQHEDSKKRTESRRYLFVCINRQENGLLQYMNLLATSGYLSSLFNDIYQRKFMYWKVYLQNAKEPVTFSQYPFFQVLKITIKTKIKSQPRCLVNNSPLTQFFSERNMSRCAAKGQGGLAVKSMEAGAMESGLNSQSHSFFPVIWATSSTSLCLSSSFIHLGGRRACPLQGVGKINELIHVKGSNTAWHILSIS